MGTFYQIFLEAIKLVLAGIAGGLIGARANDRLARDRDSNARKRVFVGFLQKWQAEIAIPNRDQPQFFAMTDPAIVAYDSKLAAFCEQVAWVKGCYPDADKFKALTVRVANLNINDWKNKKPRDVILEAVGELLKFTA
jgi:hypothetical protein